MSGSPTCPYAFRIGLFTLGRPDGELSAHLPACARCREELAALRDLPAMLAMAREAGAVPERPGREPAEALLSRVLGALRDRRRERRRRLAVALAVAAVLAATAGGGLAGVIGTRDPGPPPAATRLGEASRLSVGAAATLTPEAWGTRIEVHLTGLAPGTSCRLLARGRDGRVETAASWRVTYRSALDAVGMTSISPGDLAAIEVVDTTGRRLVTVPVPPERPEEGSTR